MTAERFWNEAAVEEVAVSDPTVSVPADDEERYAWTELTSGVKKATDAVAFAKSDVPETVRP